MWPSTIEQLQTFYVEDRALFAKLVLQFSRSPFESLLVLATWLWLEDFGFENIFSIIMALGDPLIVDFAYEAVSCFRCLESSEPPNEFDGIPLTARRIKKDISLQIIYKHRYSTIIGIKNFLTTICSRIFSDILQQVLPPSSSPSYFTRLRRPLNIPGFPHPTFRGITVMPIPHIRDNLPNNNLFIFPNGVWGWSAHCIATENDRTIFLTFSRGFPVSEAEVKELFTNEYGENCVEGIFMSENNGDFPNSGQQQSLYARLVLDSVATVDRILDGENRQKFQINRKHIWARKYEERLRKK